MQITNLTVKTKNDKTILNNINIHAKKGELLAIMGPSGSGKTTLLDLLTQNIRSNLHYDGILNAQGSIKYVPQEDFLHGFYTVREYLDHYISLSYKNISQAEREQIIKTNAELTGLTSALNTKVGDVFRKGLSGGQKRRLSIALELVSKPDILVLDEPTSGLDSMSAFHIVEVLNKLTREGICVICTLHQPSSQIWALLDKILLLANGHICYLGSTEGAKPFFESTGKLMPANNYNPADYYLFQINSDFDASIIPAKINQSFLTWESSGKAKEFEALREKEETEAQRPSSTKQSEVASLTHGEAKFKMTSKKRTNAVEKCLSLCKRNIFNSIMNPGILGVRLFMYTMLTFMVGFMYFNLGDNFTDKDIVSRTSLLFYVDAFLVFMSIAVLPFFMVERSIINKEVKNKLYRPWHYQIARFITAIPGIALIAIISTILVVLPSGINGFGIFFVILLLSLIIAESLTMLVSLLVPHYIIGMALVAGFYGMFMLCQGFLIVKSDIPGYFIWVYYIAFHTYSFEAFMHNEFSGIDSFNSALYSNGDDVLEFYSMGKVKIWKDIVILVCYCILIEIFTTIVMAIMFRRKKIQWKGSNQIHNQPQITTL